MALCKNDTLTFVGLPGNNFLNVAAAGHGSSFVIPRDIDCPPLSWSAEDEGMEHTKGPPIDPHSLHSPPPLSSRQ